MVSVSSCSQCYVEWLLSIHWHGQSVFVFSVLRGMVAKHTLAWLVCLHVSVLRGMVAKHTLAWSECLHVLSVTWNGC